MKHTWIAPVAALVVGAAGGYISGKNNSPPADAGSAEPAVRTRTSARPGGSTVSAEASRKTVRPSGTLEIANMPGNSSRIQALLEFYSGLSPEQLAEEAGKLDALPMNERIMASFLLFGKWAETDPTAAMSFSNTMGFAGAFVRPTILQSWASVDPENAAKYYAQNPREFAMMGMMGGGRGQGAASIIASEWARQDPAGALAWAATLGQEKGRAMNSVVSEIAKTDPEKAAGMITQLDEADRAEAYRIVASQFGAKDFTDAQQWVRTLPADDQPAALASAIAGLSNSDPDAAAREAARMPDGEAKDRLIPDIVGDLARKDPQAAADFLSKQTSERARRDGMRELMPAWTNQDPAAALRYADGIEDPDVRDSALATYVWSDNTSSPAAVFATAATIGDEGDRSRAMGVAAMRWMREDKDAATAAIQASPDLSDEAKQRITEGGGFWGGDRGGNRGGGNRGNRGNRGGNRGG